MGLDMFFVIKKDNQPDKDVNFKDPVYYFRKHSDLHGWLMDKYLEENPNKKRDDFNLVFFEITKEMVKELKEYCKVPNKKEYEGFFWGKSRPEDWIETENECIPKLELELDNLRWGEKLYYLPYW